MIEKKEKKQAIIVDLDGTLANCDHRLHYLKGEKKDWKSFFENIDYDQINLNVLTVVKHFHDLNHGVLIVTGRPRACHEKTVQWLRKYLMSFVKSRSIDFDLFMRKDGDYQPDQSFKQQVYEHLIAPDYDVKLVLEDRDQVVKMWRSLGLECWQVAEGNF